MSQSTDAELIAATLSGDHHAFAALVRRHERRVAITARSVVGLLPQEEIADIVQEILLLVYRALASFRGDAQFSTWLTRIALRYCYREAKRRRRRRGLFFSYDDPGPYESTRTADERFAGTDRTDRALIAEERKSDVLEALQGLPEEFRTVLVLRIVEEMSVEEVAAALEISTGTVKSRLFRAKERMRAMLAGKELEFELE